jgi:hypothetical protein
VQNGLAMRRRAFRSPKIISADLQDNGRSLPNDFAGLKSYFAVRACRFAS